ncbi:transporter substrate-binding domain-containing protein [Shewanella corallii]|uniref:Transporter substrate-binding domain-containing protein n=1 Tax=Shewanella corallii TaxID=560080 RepID=A0ABT0N913_9GAMM|nr:transporter substrate-binding domain-containing protein [Shewanella corallii]MCL2914899.1 transporter substrate-binding domain-containing protein [Shewanella corallii]
MSVTIWRRLLANKELSPDWQAVSDSSEKGTEQGALGRKTPPDLILPPLPIPTDYTKLTLPLDLQVYLYRRQSLQNESVTPYRVGVVKGSPALALVPHELLGNLVEYPSRDDMLKDAVRGNLMVFVDLPGGDSYWRATGLSTAGWHAEAVGRLALNVGLNPTGEISPDQLSSMIGQLNNEYIEELKRSFYGPEAGESKLIIAAQTGISPYADIGSDGQLHGLYVDIWQAWSAQTGIPVSFLASDMQQSLKDVFLGLADVQIGYPQGDTSKQSVLESAWQIYGVTSRVFTPVSHEFNPTGAGETLGVFKTAPYIATLKSDLPNAEITEYESSTQMLSALESGQITAMVAAGRWAETLLVSNGTWDQYRVLDGFEYSTRIEALILPSRPALKKIIADGFAAIPGDVLAEVEAKWIYGPRDRYYAQQASQVPLSAAERGYLDQLGELNVGYLNDWAPFEFTRDTRMSGINAEVLQLIGTRLGVPLRPRAYESFQQLQQALRVGEVQMIGSLQPSADRLQDISFTDSYWPSPWAVASTDDSRIFSLGQLAGKKVMVVEGYSMAADLMLMRPKIELIMVSDVNDGLSRLVAGEADLLIGKLAALAWEVQQGEYDLRLSMLTDVGAERSHIGVNNQYSGLVPLINRALQHIEEHEMRAIYEHWVPADLRRQEMSLSQGFALPWPMAVGILVICLVSVLGYRMFARNRSIDFLQTDPQTGLIGRHLLDDRLNQAVLLHHRQQARFALFFISIEGMEAIAATSGKDAAEAALSRMVARLAAGIRRSDTLARFSHQELVVILPFVSNEEHLGQLARNIQSLLTEGDPEIESSLLKVGIGIALYPKDGVDPIALMAQAAKLTEQALESGAGIRVA